MVVTRRFASYWLLSLAFSVGFGEVFLSGVVTGNPVVFQNFLAITAYYAVLCLALAWVVERIGFKEALLAFFFLGLTLESLVWGNISGPTDVPAILFFGLLYVLLFGLPLWVTNKMFGGPAQTAKFFLKESHK